MNRIGKAAPRTIMWVTVAGLSLVFGAWMVIAAWATGQPTVILARTTNQALEFGVQGFNLLVTIGVGLALLVGGAILFVVQARADRVWPAAAFVLGVISTVVVSSP